MFRTFLFVEGKQGATTRKEGGGELGKGIREEEEREGESRRSGRWKAKG